MQKNNRYTDESAFVTRVLEEASLPPDKRGGQREVVIIGEISYIGSNSSGKTYRFIASMDQTGRGISGRRIEYTQDVRLDHGDYDLPEASDFLTSIARKIAVNEHPSARYISVNGDKMIVPSLFTEGLLSNRHIA